MKGNFKFGYNTKKKSAKGAIKGVFALKDISTASLSEELSKRTGVQSLNIDPYEEIIIESKSGKQTIVGPAIILINQD